MLTLQELLQLDYDALDAELDKYTITELESIAAEFYHSRTCYKKECRKNRFFLNYVLRKRFMKKNSVFSWTPENKKRFLFVNTKIIEAFVSAYKKSKEIMEELESKINSGDLFFKDYEISIEMNLYLKQHEQLNDSEDSFLYVLSEPLPFYKVLEDNFGREHKNLLEKENLAYLDSFNYNKEYFKGEFDNDYIGRPIYCLIDHQHWSFQDIIDISRIWVDVDVSYQSYIDI